MLEPSQPPPVKGDKAWYSQRPPTTDPDARALPYAVADPKRNADERLDELNTLSGWNVYPGSTSQPSALAIMRLEDALRQSQRTGRELLSAQEDYILSAISLLRARHLWGPRFFNDTALAVAGEGENGDFRHALNVINTLRATKRLPFGGEAEARWVWDATEQLRTLSTDDYEQASSIVLSGRVPLLRGLGTVAREDLIQAERELVYQSRSFERFRRTYLVAVASDYFDLLRTRDSIVNQQRQLASLTQFSLATAARVEAGRLEDFQRAITESRVSSAASALSGLREVYSLQLDRFRVRLGLPQDARFDLSDEVPQLPEPATDQEAAAAAALRYRLDLQNAADRLDDSRRGLENAKNGLLPDLDLTASVTVPTDDDERVGGLEFDPGETRYRAGITLSLPLDRRAQALSVRESQIRLERAVRELDQRRDEITVSSRAAVRAIELARLQLNLAEKQVEINRRRLRGQKLQEATVPPQTIVDTENDLLQAENDRDRARAQLRTAILNFLLETDQLRVSRDGQLVPLPGMEFAPTSP